MMRVRNGSVLVALGLSLLPGCAQPSGEKPLRAFSLPVVHVSSSALALRWLKQAQDVETGGWKTQKWGGMEGMDCGVSGLALLAFLGYGCDDRDRAFGDTVRRTIEFLIARQEKEGPQRGSFGESEYAQAICTMALAEAYYMIGRRSYWGTRLKDAAQRGIDYIVASLPDDTVGYYDMPVMVWQILALKSGWVCELNVPENAREKARRFIDLCLLDDYASPRRFSVNPRWAMVGSMSATAMSLDARLRLGSKRTSEDCVGQAKRLLADDRYLKIGQEARQLHTIFFMTNAFFAMGSQYWKDWNSAFNDGLRARQVKEGPYAGSWPIEGSDYGHVGGRVYTTAMACLALEVYFIYLPIYTGEF